MHNKNNSVSPDDICSLLHELADLSGKAVLPYFRTDLEISDKAAPGQFDPVTLADRAAETAIRARLAEILPKHGIIGEEFDDKPAVPVDGETCSWVIDPIDGTRGFISGFPTWGTLIGLIRNDLPFMGLMNQPFTCERYWSDGVGSFYRGPEGSRKLATRPCSSLEQAIMSSTAPEMFKTPDDKAVFQSLSDQVRLTRYGGDCYAYCLLASGHIDIVMERGLKIYDIAPLIPIIENAGGVVTGWDGSPAVNGGYVLASGDPRLHEIILGQLSSR